MKFSFRFRATCSFLAATMVSSPAMATADNAGPTDVPVDVRLESAEVGFPCSSNDGRHTEIEYRVRPSEKDWVLWELDEEDDRRRETENHTPGAYRSFFMRAEDESLRLLFSREQIPDRDGIALKGTYKLMASKKAKALPGRVIEVGRSGSFETGGLRFEYESEQGGTEYLEESMRGWSGHVTFTFPETRPLAAIELRDEQGALVEATPATRSRGKAHFYLASSGVPRQLNVVVIPSEEDKPVTLSFEKTVSLGSAGELWAAGEAAANKSAVPSGSLREKSAKATPSAICRVDVAVEKIDLQACADEGKSASPGVSIYLRLLHRDELAPFFGDSRCAVQAFDAKGRLLVGSGTFWGTEKGETRLIIHFDELPEGDWITLDSQLSAQCPASRRVLPPRTLPLGEEGSFQAGPVRVQYAPCSSAWPGRKKNPAVALTFPNDGRIEEGIAFQGADGQPIKVLGDMTCIDGDTVTREFVFPLSTQGPVRVEMTLREGIEPCLVPLKARLGFSGLQKTEEKPAAERKAVPSSSANIAD